MFRSILTLLAVATALPASPAIAQFSNPKLAPGMSVERRFAPPEATHDHSSTAYEGARRGEAAWIAAFGDLLLDESQAAYVWEHARSMHYDNKLKKTETALVRKRLIASYREYERELRRGRAKAAKQLWEEKYAELAQTYRLDEYQINWTTGTIYWPTLAASPRYAQYRQNIGALIDHVVRYGMGTDPVYRDRIARECDSFRNQLRADATKDLPSARDEYLAMQRFLVGLKYTPYLVNNTPLPKQLAMK